MVYCCIGDNVQNIRFAFSKVLIGTKAIYVAKNHKSAVLAAAVYNGPGKHLLTQNLELGSKENYRISFRTYETCTVEDLANANILILGNAVDIENQPISNKLHKFYEEMKNKRKEIILLTPTLPRRTDGEARMFIGVSAVVKYTK